MPSIAIIAKGPSISRCKRKWIDKYDEVAICGRPVFDKYKKYIGDRAHYDFCNCGDPRIYPKGVMKKLGIIKVINTNKPTKKNIVKNKKCIYCPDGIEYDPNGRFKVINFFKTKYNLDPATGTIAIQYLLQLKKYDKIGLFGFDLMMEGENVYYFPKNEVQQSLLRLYNNKIYGKNGKRILKSGHESNKTLTYIKDVIKNNKNIQFEILSNRKFGNFTNLTIL